MVFSNLTGRKKITILKLKAFTFCDNLIISTQRKLAAITYGRTCRAIEIFKQHIIIIKSCPNTVFNPIRPGVFFIMQFQAAVRH